MTTPRAKRRVSRTRFSDIQQWNRYDLIALCCVLAALFAARSFAGNAWKGRAMRSWVARPASIDALYTQVASSGKRTVNRIVCRFSYEYEGKTYQGRRITVHGGIDNPWDGEWYERLSRARESGSTITCYVNPGDPADAILKREVGWAELGGAMFIFAASTAYVIGLVAHRRYGVHE